MGRTAVVLHFLQHRRIIGGIGDDGDTGVIFTGPAQHGRTADVNVLHRILESDSRLGDSLLEGIQIHHQQIDRRHSQFGGAGDVFGIFALIQETTVNLRMQRLHPPIETLRITRVIGYFHHREPDAAQVGRTASSGEQFHAEVVQTTGKGI